MSPARRRGRVARQRPAKPCTAVRLRSAPLTTLEAWVGEHAQVTGPLELVFDRPWASVWRAPTAAGDVWLKRCAPVQAFEPLLTAVLARRWPDLLPEGIAHDHSRRW